MHVILINSLLQAMVLPLLHLPWTMWCYAALGHEELPRMQTILRKLQQAHGGGRMAWSGTCRIIYSPHPGVL